MSSSSLLCAPQKEKTMTVYVHGTFSIKPHMSFKTLFDLLADNIDDSVYYRTSELNRQDPFFFKNQAMSYLGLKKIDFRHPSTLQAAPIIAHIYDQIANYVHYCQSDEYYTFGWSGLVSNKFRYEEAKILYKALSNVVQANLKQGYTTKIRIISYSHGGNLALHLGSVHVTKAPAEQIEVSELYLLGTPIQCETDYLINSPVFGKVYNIYSPADGVQTMDFFSFKRFFSKRRFSHSKRIPSLDKVTQIKLKVVDYIAHGDEKPEISKNRVHRKRHYKRKIFDPGHYELWFMGWTLSNYRKKLPFYPLPTMVFLPSIIKNIETLDHQLSEDIIVTIEPALEMMTITNHADKRKRKKYSFTAPFIPLYLLEELKEKTLSYAPQNYTADMNEEKIIQAKKLAQYEHDELEKLKYQEHKEMKKRHGKNTIVLTPQPTPKKIILT